jgi:hypothetical protein
MVAKTMAVSEMEARIMPIPSMVWVTRLSLLSRIAQNAPAMATALIGRLIRKASRHDSAIIEVPYSISQPPMIGPNAAATPAVAPQMPKATPRSLPLNVAETIDSVEGDIIAAPMPCSARNPIMMAMEADVPVPSDESAKTAAPATKMLRRPYWSPSLPQVINPAAKTSE